MAEWILNFWDSFYPWAASQPTFIQVAIGNGLFFIALAFVYAVLYLCTKAILRVIAAIFAVLSSSSSRLVLLIILAILALVAILWSSF
jgi:hypothetical protein